MRFFTFFSIVMVINLQIIPLINATAITGHLDRIDESTHSLTLKISVAPDDYVYVDYLQITTDNPHVQLAPWQTTTPIIAVFDPAFNDHKKAFNGDALLQMQAFVDATKTIASMNVHVSYYLQSQGSILQETLTLNFPGEPSINTQTTIDIPTAHEIQTVPAAPTAPAPSSWLSWITHTMEHSTSLPLRLLFVFLMGLLMSLTPCIYPMIPITAGILQTQATRSLYMSFLLAFSYTLGIATTFSFLGLLAAFAGQAMGNIMAQPLFIIPMVALLVYLALAMIGVYEMYIPSFLQPRDHKISGGSFLSAFSFGAISGIVASPCLSPGLLCLLCLVTTLGSKLLGFILLFVFGLGLGVPLLIIGTFSSSLSLLPRAGIWMVQVKKLFGFGMLAMCLYFLNNILAWATMSWIIPVFVLSIGIIFLYEATRHYRFWRTFYKILGIALIASSVFFTFKAWEYNYLPHLAYQWENDYYKARERARTENKKLFIDIGAPYCSICKAIDATLFSNATVQEFLEKNTIPVKIDGSLAANGPLLQQFHILGFPAVLLLDPQTETIIKQWGSELYGIAPEKFISEMMALLA